MRKQSGSQADRRDLRAGPQNRCHGYTCAWESLIMEHCCFFFSISMKVISNRSMEQRETFIYKTKFNGAVSVGFLFMMHLVLCLTICGTESPAPTPKLLSYMYEPVLAPIANVGLSACGLQKRKRIPAFGSAFYFCLQKTTTRSSGLNPLRTVLYLLIIQHHSVLLPPSRVCVKHPLK